MGFLLIFTGTNSVDPENLWGMAEYGLSGIWVMTESTVYNFNDEHVASYLQIQIVAAVTKGLPFERVPGWPWRGVKDGGKASMGTQ